MTFWIFRIYKEYCLGSDVILFLSTKTLPKIYYGLMCPVVTRKKSQNVIRSYFTYLHIYIILDNSGKKISMFKL